MDQQLDGKIALVTGAGSGIGRACALALARAGATVVVSDISAGQGEQTASAIAEAGGAAQFVRADVTDARQVEALIRATVQAHGRLDAACNNAGVLGAQARLADYPEESWSQVIATNLTGVWLCMKYEIGAMLAGRGGAIVNMASVLGTVGFPSVAPYVAAKHGVIGLTKTAALEYARQGIRVNAVCPGFIATPLLEQAGIREGTDQFARIASRHAMRRLGEPDEIAEAVVWLCSGASSFVTGHALVVDGGFAAQ